MSKILDDIKHDLGVFPEDTQFDTDIKALINTAFFKLTQLGVGPTLGFFVEGDEEWEDFTNDDRLQGVRTYVYLNTKLVFDPPQTGFVVASFERQIEELGIRLNYVVEYG